MGDSPAEINEAQENAYGITTSRRTAIPLELGVMLLLLVAVSVMSQVVDPVYSAVQWHWMSSRPIYVLYGMVYDVSILGLILFVFYVAGDAVSMMGIVRPKLLRDIGWSVLAASILVAIGLLSSWWMTTEYDELAEYYRSQEVPGPMSVIVGALGIIVRASVEELTFRGYFLTRLTELHRSISVAALTSSLAFAAVHWYQGPGGLIQAFAVGMSLCLVTIRSKAIWPAMAAHSVSNLYWQYG